MFFYGQDPILFISIFPKQILIRRNQQNRTSYQQLLWLEKCVRLLNIFQSILNILTIQFNFKSKNLEQKSKETKYSQKKPNEKTSLLTSSKN